MTQRLIAEPTAALDTIRDPFARHTEMLCSLRQQLLLRREDQAGAVLTVVSPGAQEGKSRLASELAWLFAQLGESTLLVDANLRRPAQQQFFAGAGTPPGLAEALSQGGAPAVHEVHAAAHLAVVLAGAPPKQPADLLSRRGFGQLLDGWRQHFRYIVLDTPAFSAGADALAVAAEAGAALLLVREQHSSMDGLRTVAVRLRAARVNVLGTVVVGF